MATFQATAQYDIGNIVPLGDPLVKTPISNGFQVTDPVGNFADVLGNLTLNLQGNIVGTATSISQYFSSDLAYTSFINLEADMQTGSYYYDYGYLIDGQTLYGETGETAYWLRGNDIVNGSIYADKLAGFSGNDFVYGGDDNDEVQGWNGDDYLDGGAGYDILRGSFGNDELLGGLNGDSLFGGQGNDLLRGGGGLDKLDGGIGNDILIGALGTDTLTGGAGADTFRFTTALDGVTNVDTITDFARGEDTIELSVSIFTAFADQVGQRVACGDILKYNVGEQALYYDANQLDQSMGVKFAIVGSSAQVWEGNNFLIVS